MKSTFFRTCTRITAKFRVRGVGGYAISRVQTYSSTGLRLAFHTKGSFVTKASRDVSSTRVRNWTEFLRSFDADVPRGDGRVERFARDVHLRAYVRETHNERERESGLVVFPHIFGKVSILSCERCTYPQGDALHDSERGTRPKRPDTSLKRVLTQEWCWTHTHWTLSRASSASSHACRFVCRRGRLLLEDDFFLESPTVFKNVFLFRHVPKKRSRFETEPQRLNAGSVCQALRSCLRRARATARFDPRHSLGKSFQHDSERSSVYTSLVRGFPQHSKIVQSPRKCSTKLRTPRQSGSGSMGSVLR